MRAFEYIGCFEGAKRRDWLIAIALQVRYATGAIRNISVEEVGKRIVKAIPNVLQQLTSLASSQDQVITVDFDTVFCF